MSAFAVCFHRDGAPAKRDVVEAMLDAQRHRGGDQQAVLLREHVGLGYNALWTTPEERDQVQPLGLAGLPYSIVWDGRIDNRDELVRTLGNDPALKSRPDAELALRLFALREEEAFPAILGAFALVIHDHRDRSIVMARDPIGHRSLSYRLTKDLLLVATEESGILAHPHTPKRVNRRQLAVLCACMGLDDGSTFFEEVRKLLPGQSMRVSASRHSLQRYWAVDTGNRIRYRDDRQYAEHYRELLEQAVACRSRRIGHLGVMASGGLDSGPITAIAASRNDQATYAFTWAFKEFPECNEISYVRELADRFQIRSIGVNCDQYAPFSEFDNWPVHPDTPDQDPYRRFLDQTYAHAEQEGVRVLLNGMSGDNLYLSGNHWFWSLLGRGKYRLGLSSARWYVDQAGIQRFVRTILIRSLLPKRVMALLRPPKLPLWLTPAARELIGDTMERWPPECEHAERSSQCLNCLLLRCSDFLSWEAKWSAAHDIEVRYPMRDRRIIEFMLGVPDEQLRYKGLDRPVLRRAVSDLLPAKQLNRRDKTNFTPVFQRGKNAASGQIDEILNSPSAIWKEFIQENWLGDDKTTTQNISNTLKWISIGIELWRRNLGLEKPGTVRS